MHDQWITRMVDAGNLRKSFRTSDFASLKGLFNECSEYRHSANGSSQTRPCISAKGKWSKHLHALAWAENAEIARTVDLSLKNCMIEWEGGDGEGFWMHRAKIGVRRFAPTSRAAIQKQNSI
jgi:hypothetical protein